MTVSERVVLSYLADGYTPSGVQVSAAAGEAFSATKVVILPRRAASPSRFRATRPTIVSTAGQTRCRDAPITIRSAVARHGERPRAALLTLAAERARGPVIRIMAIAVLITIMAAPRVVPTIGGSCSRQPMKRQEDTKGKVILTRPIRCSGHPNCGPKHDAAFGRCESRTDCCQARSGFLGLANGSH